MSTALVAVQHFAQPVRLTPRTPCDARVCVGTHASQLVRRVSMSVGSIDRSCKRPAVQRSAGRSAALQERAQLARECLLAVHRMPVDRSADLSRACVCAIMRSREGERACERMRASVRVCASVRACVRAGERACERVCECASACASVRACVRACAEIRDRMIRLAETLPRGLARRSRRRNV